MDVLQDGPQVFRTIKATMQKIYIIDKLALLPQS